MKKKEILFNYFLQKAVQTEQKLLDVEDYKTALLAVILSRATVFCRFASGCTTQTVYICKPKFAEELFLCLCIDAEEHGDHLLKAFDFHETWHAWQARWKGNDIEDEDLTKYLNNLYPKIHFMQKEDKQMYEKLLGDEAFQAMADNSGSPGRICAVSVEKLEMPKDCEEVAMIDRAWERLMLDSGFTKMLNLSGKHDHHGCSYPHNRYMQKRDFLLTHI